MTDLLYFFSITISEEAQAAQTILRGFGTILAVIPFSVSCASGFFIGKAIGEGDQDTIKTYFRVSIYFSLALGLFFVIVLFSLQNLIFELYTDSQETQEQLSQVWPVIIVYALFDCP